MKRIVVSMWDKYVMEITDEEYEQLQNGDVDVIELFVEKQSTDKVTWKNGGTGWE